MRLGVSPAAASTSTGVFTQRFEALFPPRCSLLRSPPFVPVYLCTNVGHGVLPATLPAPFVPHSASLGPAMAMRVLSVPVPVSAPPTSLDECFFFIYLVSDFPAVRFSVSSGCARRHSVSWFSPLFPFFNWIVCLSGVESFELFIYFGDQTLVQGIISKYIFPYVWFPFYIADVFLSH